MSAADVQSYFKEVIDEMTAEHGKPPTAKQLASVSGLTVKEAEDVLSTLVVKEPPAKRRRHKQPADPEPSAEEPAPPSVKEPVPATPEVIPSSEDLGTPHYAVLPDNQLGDSQVYPTPPKAPGSPEVQNTLRGTSQMCGPQFLVCFRMFSHVMSPVFCSPRSLETLMAAQRFNHGKSQIG